MSSGARDCGNHVVGRVAEGGSGGDREATGVGVPGEVLTLTPRKRTRGPSTRLASGSGEAVGSGVMSGTCAFCAIIRGEEKAVTILETERLIAFLDHRPLFYGHTLLVPKQHMVLLSDLHTGGILGREQLAAGDLIGASRVCAKQPANGRSVGYSSRHIDSSKPSD